MSELVLTLLSKDHISLGSVRTLPYLRVAEYNGLLWLRGIISGHDSDIRLWQLPAIQTYTVDDAHNLFPQGASTPVLNVKGLTWTPIDKYIPLEIPTSALPAKIESAVPVRLVQAMHENSCVALVTTFAYWKAYAYSAPAVRLGVLQFAASPAGSILIMGLPLPSLPGQSYWRRGQILIPAGMDFEIPLIATLMERGLALQEHTLILLQPDGSWHMLPAGAFAPASRSAVRLTEKNLTHGL